MRVRLLVGRRGRFQFYTCDHRCKKQANRHSRAASAVTLGQSRVFLGIRFRRRGPFQFYTGDLRFGNKPIGILWMRRRLFWVSLVCFAYSLVSRRGRFQFYTGDRRFEN